MAQIIIILRLFVNPSKRQPIERSNNVYAIRPATKEKLALCKNASDTDAISAIKQEFPNIQTEGLK